MAATKAELLKEIKRLRRRVAALERAAKAQSAGSKAALAEALEQQAGTSEILRVISSSPIDIQPAFAAAASAARLCDAFDAKIFQVDTDGLRVVAHVGPIPAHSVGLGQEPGGNGLDVHLHAPGDSHCLKKLTPLRLIAIKNHKGEICRLNRA